MLVNFYIVDERRKITISIAGCSRQGEIIRIPGSNWLYRITKLISIGGGIHRGELMRHRRVG